MAKVLRVAAIVVGIVAMAIPVVGQIVGTVALTTALGVSAATLATIATVASISSAVLGLAAGLLAKPKIPKLGGAGQQLEWSANPAAGEPYFMGDGMTGAGIFHQASWGAKNKYLGIVGALSVCTIQSYDGLYADNTLVSFSGRNATGYYANHLYISTQLGAVPEASALDMTAPDASNMPDWSSSHKTSGIATVGLVLVADVDNGKVYSGGVPKLTNRIKGVKAYDARLDSTQVGGSGSQVALDETTYAYSENPWVHASTYAIGRWQNGIRVIGPGLSPAQVDFASYMAAANVADANGWKISGLIMSTDRKWEALKAMAQAGGGWPMPTGAHLACLVNEPKVSIATLTEDDVKGAVVAPQMRTRRDRINGAIPRYRSAAHGWEVVPGTVVRNSTYLAEDGGAESTREIEFPLVADIGDGAGKNQAAQLAAYEVANSRERGPISIELGYAWSQLKLGDCVTIDLPSANLNSQKAVVIGRTINVAHNTVTLDFRTETDSKHAWALGIAGSVTTPPTVAQPHGTGDNGGQTAFTVTGPPQRTTFKYDASLVPLDGEFGTGGAGRALTFKLYGPSGEVLSGITWTSTVQNGSVSGFDNGDSPQAMSGSGTGTLNVTDIGAATNAVLIEADYLGRKYPLTVTLTREVQGATSGGGGGGGGGTTFSGPYNSFNSGTFTDLTGNISFTPSGTTANINVALDCMPEDGLSGSWTVELRVWNVTAGAIVGSVVSDGSNWIAIDYNGDPASFLVNVGATGLSGATNFRVDARISSGTGRIHYTTGSVTISN